MMDARWTRARQKGFSVTELLVAITVSLVLLAGVIQLLVSNKQAYRLQENTSVLNENARFANQRLSQILRMGSHWAGGGKDAIKPHANVTGHSDTCVKHLATSSSDTGTVLGVEGFNGGTTSPFSDCVSDTNYVANSDMVLVRYSDPNECIDSGSLGGGTTGDDAKLWIRSSVGFNAVAFQGKDKQDVMDTNAALSADQPGVLNCAYRAYALYIRPCQITGTGGACDSTLDDTPTLVRLRVDIEDSTSTDVEPMHDALVAGVEQMQIVYGEDFNNNGTADRYLAANNVNDWNNVVSLRLNLLIRNLERDIAYNGATSITMLDGFSYTVPTGDHRYRRKQYTAVIQIRNMSRG